MIKERMNMYLDLLTDDGRGFHVSNVFPRKSWQVYHDGIGGLPRCFITEAGPGI